MEKQNYFVQQRDRGIKILQSLSDLEEIKHPIWKITKDARVYDEDDIFVLEGKVRNWQSETMSILNAIGISKESYELVFQFNFALTSMLDKRKALAEEIQLGLNYLANIQKEEIIDPHFKEETSFLQRDFHLDLDGLKLMPELVPVIYSRIDEIEKGLNAEMPLSVIILSGSTLEGILLNIAKHNQEPFNKAKSSPKDKNGNVKLYSFWKLQDYIDVAFELGYLKVDIKRLSHALGDFRNYIHPNEQIEQKFIPDMHTAEICFHILKVAICQLSEKLSSNR